jgi:hypothetical protein
MYSDLIWVTTKQAAKLLGTDKLTLFRRRRKRLGPPFEYFGDRPFYRVTDLILFRIAGVEL